MNKENDFLHNEKLQRFLEEEWKLPDGVTQQEIDDAWLAESHRRYDAYKRGEIEAVDGDLVMARLRARLEELAQNSKTQ